jgi:hypothetical protein
MPTNTNFQANSNPTSAYWAASNCTITDNYALAPDGTMTAQLITTIAHGVLSTYIINTTPGACGPCVTGQNYCMSFYAKAMPNLGNGSIVGINPTQGYGGMTFDIVNQRVFNSTLTPIATQNGTIVNTGVQVLANGWARYWFTFTAPGNGNPTYEFAVWEQTMGAFYNTTGGYNCLIWGTQFEPGNYPSQYMSWGPTITTTRGQDNISIAAPGAAVINPSLPFTITLGATPQAAWNLEPSGAYLLDWSNVGSARRKSSIYTGGSGASGNLQGVCSGDVSGDSVNLGAGSGYSNANPHIIKYAYAGVGKPMTFLVDGLVYGTQPNGPQRGTGPEAANIYLGNYSAGSAPWNGWISSLLITTP